MRLDFRMPDQEVRCSAWHRLKRLISVSSKYSFDVAVNVAVLWPNSMSSLALEAIERRDSAILRKPWPGVTWENKFVGLTLRCKLLSSSAASGGRRCLEARSLLYFSVASQSISDFGISSHSSRSELRYRTRSPLISHFEADW